MKFAVALTAMFTETGGATIPVVYSRTAYTFPADKIKSLTRSLTVAAKGLSVGVASFYKKYKKTFNMISACVHAAYLL